MGVGLMRGERRRGGRLISRHSYTFETQTLQRDPHTKGGGNQPRRATHEPTRHSTLYARVVERGLGVVCQLSGGCIGRSVQRVSRLELASILVLFL